MTYYRKSPGGRRVIKIDGETVVSITSGKLYSTVSIYFHNEFILSDIEEDTSLKEATENEFSEAYKLALGRLSMQKIDV